MERATVTVDTFYRSKEKMELMKTVTRLFVLTLLLPACIAMKVKAQSANAVLPEEKFTWKIAHAAEMSYLIYLPPGYDVKSTQRWPLMLFLHGAGERGTQVQRVAIHGPLSLVKQGTNFPFIIVAPLCPAGQLWENEPLLQLLDRLTEKHAVDTNRVYLTGLSMGGYGTWKLGLQHAERFAALAPICGGGSMIDVLLGTRHKKGEPLKSLPVWAFHGAKDDVVPVDESERMVKRMQKLGATNVTLTIYPEARHDSWKEAYADPKFYEWLLKQSR